MNKQTPVLQLNNISLSRANNLVLSSFSLNVNPGEIHWILGPNGVGKTSLLRAAAGLLALEEGDVLWNGKSISLAQIEKNLNIHYIGHVAGIKPTLTVEENLQLMCAVMDFPQQLDIVEALTKVGLLAKRHVLCRELSAGQQRRVALARLCFLSAQLWILDEPFTALDDEGIRIISELFSQHLANSGAILASTHRLFSEKEFAPSIGQYFTKLQKLQGDVV